MELLFSNKLFYAILTLIVNLGTQYIMPDIMPIFNLLFNNKWLRKLILFGLFLITTQDLMLSLFLTIIITVLVHFLLNENNRFCLIPREFRTTVRESFQQPMSRHDSSYQRYRRQFITFSTLS